MNLYRYMLFHDTGKLIDNLNIVHLTKQEKLTDNFKERKPEQLLKVIEVELMTFEELEEKIDEVYNSVNGKEELW